MFSFLACCLDVESYGIISGSVISVGYNKGRTNIKQDF